MQSIIVALEAISERMNTIEIKFMERLKALEAKYEFSRCVSNQNKRGPKRWKSNCKSIMKSIKSTTLNLPIDDHSSTKSTIESTTDAQVNLLAACDKMHIESKSKMPKAQLGLSNISIKSNRRQSYKIHIIATGDANVAVGFGKVANRKARILVHSGYSHSLIDAAFLSKLGPRMNRRKRRPPPQFGAFMINERILPVTCCVSLPVGMNGLLRFHNMFVVEGLHHHCMIAADFI